MKKVKKELVVVLAVIYAFLATAPAALAHVSVKPNQAGIASYQTFSVGVPVEKNIATVAIRLVIPEGLEHVTPNVKPGWTITTKHSEVPAGSADGNNHTEGSVIEINWTGGNIPAGQRDDFLFSAKTPGNETTLVWKAYQTYSDGSVVAWDLDKSQQPKTDDGSDDFTKSGPYSETKVVNDLKSPTTQLQTTAPELSEESNNLPLMISLLALALSGFCLYKTYKK